MEFLTENGILCNLQFGFATTFKFRHFAKILPIQYSSN